MAARMMPVVVAVSAPVGPLAEPRAPGRAVPAVWAPVVPGAAALAGVPVKGLGQVASAPPLVLVSVCWYRPHSPRWRRYARWACRGCHP